MKKQDITLNKHTFEQMEKRKTAKKTKPRYRKGDVIIQRTNPHFRMIEIVGPVGYDSENNDWIYRVKNQAGKHFEVYESSMSLSRRNNV